MGSKPLRGSGSRREDDLGSRLTVFDDEGIVSAKADGGKISRAAKVTKDVFVITIERTLGESLADRLRLMVGIFTSCLFLYCQLLGGFLFSPYAYFK